MKKQQRYYHRGTPDLPIAVRFLTDPKLNTSPTTIQRHPEVEILLVHKGALQIYHRDSIQLADAGSVVIITPNDPHDIFLGKRDTQYMDLKFPATLITLPEELYLQKEMIQPLLDGKLRLPFMIDPTHPAHPEVFGAISRIRQEQLDDLNHRGVLLNAVFSVFTAIAPYCMRNDFCQAISDPIKWCSQYLAEHYAEDISLQQLADMVHLHPNYLCTRFKKQTGFSIYDRIRTLRMDNAIGLLRHTDLPITKIAEKCGFQSASYFTQKFKAVKKKAPTVYRKWYRKHFQE